MPTIGRSPKVSARSAPAVRVTLSGTLEKGKCGKTTILVIKSCGVPVKEYYIELRITIKDKMENQVEKVS
jgi:hypothetical protein